MFVMSQRWSNFEGRMLIQIYIIQQIDQEPHSCLVKVAVRNSHIYVFCIKFLM